MQVNTAPALHAPQSKSKLIAAKTDAALLHFHLALLQRAHLDRKVRQVDGSNSFRLSCMR